jgi:hypothetical protein
MMTQPIGKPYQHVERVVDAMRLKVSMHYADYINMMAFLKGLGRQDGYNGTYADIGFEWGQLNGLIVQVKLQQDESFKAAEPIISWLLEHGWTQNGNSEDARWGYRQVDFRKTENQPPMFWPSHKEWKPYTLTATVRIWPHPDSQICKKVEDGQETKYKYVCEG